MNIADAAGAKGADKGRRHEPSSRKDAVHRAALV
jgi:hypothetical protein